MQVSFNGLRLTDLNTADKRVLDNCQIVGLENTPDNDAYLLRYTSRGQVKTMRIAPSAKNIFKAADELIKIESALLRGFMQKEEHVPVIADITFDVNA